MENMVPKAVTNKNINLKGSLENIRKRMGRTTQNKVSSPVLLLVFSYWAQSRDPSFHSWNKPTTRIIIKKKTLRASINEKLNLIEAKAGRRRTISTSKIRKIIASKKKRKEKGSRADLIGSNPHSKGELFSRSLKARLDSIQPKAITTTDRIIATIAAQKVLIICSIRDS